MEGEGWKRESSCNLEAVVANNESVVPVSWGGLEGLSSWGLPAIRFSGGSGECFGRVVGGRLRWDFRKTR